MVQDEGEWHAVMDATEWRVIECAAELAAKGRHGEAEATRWAAGYHGRRDDQAEPAMLV